MGSFISMPLLWITALSENPLMYNIRYVFAYVCLKLWQYFRKSRFDLYDYHARRQPFKHGALVPVEEYELETPRKIDNLDEFSDSAYCFATNPDNEFVGIHISRLPNENVECAVALRMSDGKEYRLPQENSIQRATVEDNTFGSSRLKLQCLIPMRKWRVFFNGILEEISGSETSERYKHVKFTLLWTPSTDVFDFSCDMSKQIILDTVAAQLYLSPTTFLKRLKKISDCYEHPGMFHGTLKIEDEKQKEIYLWGSKGRYMGEYPEEESNITKVFGSFEDGSFVCLGFYTYPGILESFPFGYFMRADGNIFAIDQIDGFEEISTQRRTKIYFVAGEHDYVMTLKPTKGHRHESQNDKTLRMKTMKLKIKDKVGNGFLVEGILKRQQVTENAEKSSEKKINKKQMQVSGLFTVPFVNERCQDSSLTGGKGSSLAKLMKLSSSLRSKHGKCEFTVPNGIVVTTRAYQEFIKGTLENLLTSFELDIWNSNGSDITILCKKIVDVVGTAKIPKKVVHSILTDLKVIYSDSVSEKKFSVRSSATGEDTEQMSAAGQMETFLGVKGFNEIIKAVAKCWASQFTFQAVEYKKRYGQKLNTPMAVVIQEMVACQSAGVMFTCDPVTGNPSLISITGNWGLGESVVSGSAEPDTILLKKNVKNEIQFYSETIGDKKTHTVLDTMSGTKDVEISEEQSRNCCISHETAMSLGNIAVEIEKYYGSSQDTEWGTANGNIFFFQSRPVTSIDMITEFETRHFYDNFQRTNKEFFSKANVGEVMPKACSILGTDVMWKYFEIRDSTSVLKWDRQDHIKKPYFIKKFAIYMNHWLLAMLEGFFPMESEPNDFAKSVVISTFGRLIDDTDMRLVAKERFCLRKVSSAPLWEKIGLNAMLFFSGVLTRRKAKEIEEMEISVEDCSSSQQVFEKIAKEFDIFADALNLHLHCSFSSSMWNLPILALLARSNGDWNSEVFSDFANLVKVSSGVLSADVPAALEDLADAVTKCIDKEKFKQLKTEEALEWLETSNTDASMQFQNFKRNHGHRCIMELDVGSHTWAMDPKPLISTLQGLLDSSTGYKVGKSIESAWQSISNLKIKIGLLDKLKLLFVVPNARRAVQSREFSKSFFVKCISKVRTPMHHLADMMVKEGRLPRKEMLFYLCLEEINQLLKTRSPLLVSKAFKRWKVQNELDNLRFPEIIRGIPKSIADEEEIVPCENGFTMTGVPVSQGISKAPARVIMSVNEADSIQNGDILITYSTDIAWSPYFTRLSGVVTELGGLISHGAVVAREYGLPCVVALHGATKAFKSGDIVVLDGNKGTLQKVGLKLL